MIANDIMTKELITVNAESTVEDTIKLLLDNKISGVPVTNADNELIGIVSESDLLFRDKDINTPAFISLLGGIIYLEDIDKFEDQIRKKIAYKIKDIMTKNVVSVTEDQSVEKIVNLMLDKKINRIPVTDKKGKLVGIVTRSDILKSF